MDFEIVKRNERKGFHVLPRRIRIFTFNVKAHPDGFTTYDSLGKAYLAAGQREQAIRNYRKSLELNPKNDNAVAMLKKIGVE